MAGNGRDTIRWWPTVTKPLNHASSFSVVLLHSGTVSFVGVRRRRFHSYAAATRNQIVLGTFRRNMGGDPGRNLDVDHDRCSGDAAFKGVL